MAQDQNPEEVLIARNNETGQVGAVTGLNEDGTPKMADVKSAKLSDLVKFQKGQNPLEAFMSNFMRQCKNPSTFGFFRVPADRYDSVGTVVADMAKDPETNAAMLKSQIVDPKSMASEVKAEARQEAPNAPGEAPRRNYAVDESKIDWTSIEKEWGIKREDLEKNGDLTSMLYNRKSQLVNVSPEFSGEKFNLEARLSFRTNPDGSVSLVPHFPQKEPKFDVAYKGYEFTKEDKEQLLTNGNLGKPVDLTNPKTGQTEKCLVSIDRLTNEIESIPVDKVFIRDKIGKTDLSMAEIGMLKNGKVVANKEIELNNGRKFTANLQYNAERREVEFLQAVSWKKTQTQEQSPDQKQRGNWVDENGNIRKITQWCKQPLSEQQQSDYMAGKQIAVTNVKDRKGNDCTVYVQFDPAAQRPKTTYNYPDKSKVVGVAEESKTQVSVNNDGKTNEATNKIKDTLQKGQTQPKDEDQQKKQKPKGPKM